jgi:hypothetical protein
MTPSFFRKFLRLWLPAGRRSTGGRPRPTRRFRPVLEDLETRLTPTTSIWIGGDISRVDGDARAHPTDANAPFEWSNSLNWLNGIVPGPGDTAQFTANTGDFTFSDLDPPNNTNDGSVTYHGPLNDSPLVDVPVTVASLQVVSGTGFSLTVPAGQALTLTGASEWDAGNIIVNATGSFTNAGGATLRLANPAGLLLSGTLTNNGTVQQAGQADIILSAASIANNAGAVYDFQTDHAFLPNSVSTSSFINSGTLKKSAGTGISDIILNTGLSNTGGTIDVESGTVEWQGNGGVSTGGTFHVAAGAVLDYGPGDLSNTFTGTYNGSGPGEFQQLAGAEIDIGTAGATFNFGPGLFQWIGGDTTFAGTAPLTNTGTMTLSGPKETTNQDEMRLDSGTLINQGTIVQNNAGDLVIRAAVLNNAVGGLYDLQTNSGFVGFGNTSSTVINSGTLQKSGGGGTSTLGINNGLSNTGGTINVTNGTLVAWDTNGGMSTGGTFTVAAGATLEYANQGASNTFTGTYTGSGAGTFLLDHGTLTVGAGGATFNFPAGFFQDKGGVLDGGTSGLTNAGVITVATDPAQNVFLQGTLNNTATVAVTGAGAWSVGSATINNQPTGLIDIQGDGTITTGNVFAGSFSNKGTVRKSGGTGASTISMFAGFNNVPGGTLDVRTGTLVPWDTNGSVTTGGTFTVAAGATLRYASQGANNTFTGTYTGSGAGTFLLDRGTLSAGAGGATFNFPAGFFQDKGGVLDGGTGGLTNTGVITVATDPAQNIFLQGTLNNAATIAVTGTGAWSVGSATINNQPTGLIDIQGDGTITTGNVFAGSLSNGGNLRKSGGTATSNITLFGGVNNTGTVEVDSGTLALGSAVAQVSASTLTGGTWNVFGTLNLAFPNPATLTTNNATVTLSGANATFSNLAGLTTNGGSLSLLGGNKLTTAGPLTNSGTITLGPGDTLSVTGAYTQTAGGLRVQIGGTPASGQFGKLAASGAANLAGTLTVSLVNGFTPGVNQSFPVVTFASRNGDFTTNNGLTFPGGQFLRAFHAGDLTLTTSVAANAGALQFSGAAFTAAENAGSATITVTRTGGSDGTVTVAYATADGSAHAGANYTATSNTLTFGPGETTKTFSVPVRDDGLVTDGLTITLSLSQPGGGATLGSPVSATLTISDADLPNVPNGPPSARLIDAAKAFAHSKEHYQQFVVNAYQQYLKRFPDDAGLNFWVSAMLAGTYSDEQVEAFFLGSDEYIANHGGPGAAWVTGMYKDLLGRTPSDAEVQGWVNALNAGTPASAVAFGFAASRERESQRVRFNYQTYLGRSPRQDEVDLWVNAFVGGLTNEDMVGGFVGSPEYYQNPNKGKNNEAAWVARAYLDVLFRPASVGEINSWLQFLG